MIFSNISCPEYDDQLLSGFISAMMKVVEMRWNEDFTFFATNKSKFKILPKESLYVVGRFPNQVKDKKIDREMNYIINSLPENLWQGDDNRVKEIKSLDCVLKPKSELIGNYIEHLWSHAPMETRILK